MYSLDGRLLVQIASYNTNLQTHASSLPQDLVDWLRPTLTVSQFLTPQLNQTAPDIVCVGFQELLPLPLGLSGWSRAVLDSRNEHIKSQLEEKAPNKERYILVGKIVHVGVAILLYARDDTVGRKFCDVQTSWIGIGGPVYMGNKGAVGIRFRIPDDDGGHGETYTFVCAHLAAHAHNLARRVHDYKSIVHSLVFSGLDASGKESLSTIYDTSHLFFLGDLNFRVVLPPEHPLASAMKEPSFASTLESHEARSSLKEYDQLLTEKKKGVVFQGLKEGDILQFKCSYKFQVGYVDRYDTARLPSWTDRILYTTYTDDPAKQNESNITNLLYTSVPSYTASDHKPIVALLLLPPSKPSNRTSSPVLRLPSGFSPQPDKWYRLKRAIGLGFDRVIGIIWWSLTFIGAGSLVVGIINFLLGLGAWKWWNITHPSANHGQ